MKKYALLNLILLVCTAAHAADSTTTCRGASFTDDGLVYENILFRTRFDSDRGTFDLYADGHNDKLEYDIGTRFSGLQFIGVVEKNSSDRVISAKMSGLHLPGNRAIEASIDMSRAKTKGKITFERTDGVPIKALLNCETILAPICRDKMTCHKICHPMIGCDESCDTKTICEPQRFD